jgi:hypothetical protein
VGIPRTWTDTLTKPPRGSDAGTSRSRDRWQRALQPRDMRTDNGRGVAWDKVRPRAKALHLTNTTPQDLSRALFLDGFTTREQTGDLSGRGVGLDSVQAGTQRQGWVVEIVSAPGKGTTCRFRLSRPPVAREAHSPPAIPG